MSSEVTARESRAAHVQTAQSLQLHGAINGGLEGGLVGLLFAGVAHHTWNAFRRKTFQFKVFVVLGFTMAGFVFGAESALVQFERAQRLHENNLRRRAQAALTSRGIHPTEAAIQAWKNEQAAQLDQQQQQSKSP
ncbi:hypothetical protein EXIGLDRAFT_715949 [Exidia glandulosa HHB12029]|uniref:HIG1 domain-containing protein n=1 Tax=Exidia glandulosa HHB12029 TaxID=1314781 RepID=A0A165QQ15_EXIGL|nr:hypothetical protein EXIGLDRAFT_715949 [Exidia glandulosa HHB12029]